MVLVKSKLLRLRGEVSHRLNSEEGLTIIELIIVMVIVGILAAVVIPIFMNQQKESIEATLKSDIRNSVVVITTEATKTQGRMPAWLPNYATKSPDNSVIVDTSRSNQYVFCLVGSNPNVDNIYYYSSATGELSLTACPSVANGGVGGNPAPGGGGGVAPPAGAGGFSPGSSFDEQSEDRMEGTKLLFLPVEHVQHPESNNAVLRAQMSGYGFDEIVQITKDDFLALSDAELNEYDMVVTYHRWWGTPPEVVDRLESYYAQGGKVMQEGDDNTTGRNPFITSTSPIPGAAGYLNYGPTSNTGLSPSFPYTFSVERVMSAGSSRCVLGMKNGGVSIAESPHPLTDETCIIVYAASNSNDGRWVTHFRYQNLSEGVGAASINWLLA